MRNITGSMADTIGEENPFRYRGYYYDSESGLYYLNARYYDPMTHRFINPDSIIASNGDITSYNLFSYCSNNPVNFSDPTGNAEAAAGAGAGFPVIGFIFFIIEEIDAAIHGRPGLIQQIWDGAVAAWNGITSWASGAWNTVCSWFSPKDESKEEEQDSPKVDVKPQQPRHQEYFPVDPYQFTPHGLVRYEYPGSDNGRIIQWRDPVLSVNIFEWDEDFKWGSHYHAMDAQWGGKHGGTHYFPGTPVPEPWNSLYFGGV